MDAFSPKIHEDSIIYLAGDESPYQLYYYDITSGRTELIAENALDECPPLISEIVPAGHPTVEAWGKKKFIAFLGYRAGFSEVYIAYPDDPETAGRLFSLTSDRMAKDSLDTGLDGLVAWVALKKNYGGGSLKEPPRFQVYAAVPPGH
jgi:hypothetical protein